MTDRFEATVRASAVSHRAFNEVAAELRRHFEAYSLTTTSWEEHEIKVTGRPALGGRTPQEWAASTSLAAWHIAPRARFEVRVAPFGPELRFIFAPARARRLGGCGGAGEGSSAPPAPARRP